MKTYTFHTTAQTLAGDIHTPVSTYLKVRDLFPQSALLESSDYHGTEDNRSFIGLHPLASIRISRGTVTLHWPDRTRTVRTLDATYTARQALREFVACFSVSGPYADCCGLYGYMAFDAVRYFEPVAVSSADAGRTDAPDVLYTLYQYLIVFHDRRSEMTLVEMLQDGEESRMAEVRRAVANRNFTTYPFACRGTLRSSLTDDEHRRLIRRAMAHCLRGDVFQLVISRRYEQDYEGDDFQLYRALRSINPSPYLFYFDFGTFRLFGSSPETHCRMEHGRATIDPIAGTIPRHADRRDDEALISRLLADPKENAEHVMLVDLARNDLSRHGHDTRVECFKDPQRYSHVIHLVSRVSTTLDDPAESIDAFIDTFPAGTLSGAPKVRALQLISEIEPHSRGAYGGCIGFIGLQGQLNQAITIRTFVSRNHRLWLQAGGGITALSDPDTEVREVEGKLGALRQALSLAQTLG